MIAVDVILQSLLSGLFMGSVYALVAIGFTLVFGVTDIVNFAHGHLVMAAMFVTYVLFKAAQLDPYLSLVLVLPLFFGVGALLYQLLIRRIVDAPHSAHMMVTLGLLIILENLANLIFGGDLRGITTGYTTSSWLMGELSVPLARAAAAARRMRLHTIRGLTPALVRRCPRAGTAEPGSGSRKGWRCPARPKSTGSRGPPPDR